MECECLEAFRLLSQVCEFEMDEKEGELVLKNAVKLSKLSKESAQLYSRKGTGRLAVSLECLDLRDYRYIGLLSWMDEEDYKIIMQN